METLYTSKNIEDLNTQGFTIIDDILPLNLAEELNAGYKTEENWELIDQVKDTHYSHVFKFDNKFLPQNGETYYAKFNRSNSLENSKLVKGVFDDFDAYSHGTHFSSGSKMTKSAAAPSEIVP